MKQYKELLLDCLHNGEKRNDRTGTGTRSVFGRQVRYDLTKGFPAITTKKLFWKGVVHELLWFLMGGTPLEGSPRESNIKYLQDNGVRIWNEWSKENGNLGPVYGSQWRNCTSVVVHPETGDFWILQQDQIEGVIKSIRKDPFSRRHIVNSWNVNQIHEMALPPCHMMFQFYVRENGHLDCQLYQRSADVFLGVPFNIASYALLTHMIAQVCGLKAGEFIHTFGDLHLYDNHIDQAKLQLSREPMELPQLWLNPEIKDIDDFKYEDIKLIDYQHHPAIKAPIAV